MGIDFNERIDVDIVQVVETCVILHNMMVRLALEQMLADEEDESGNPLQANEIVNEFYCDAVEEVEEPNISYQNIPTMSLSWIDHFL